MSRVQLDSRTMPNEATVGFWSYAHDDNILDGDAILDLARHIKEEYSLLAGEPLEIFIDRDGIAWGEEWRERIDSSLSQTIFFIPIITPRYFTRHECRRELLEFAAKAKGLGVDELLLPILYVEVADLSPESDDEVVALVAKTQYVDWHETRLLEPASRGYRAAVNSLARRLQEIASKVAEVQFNRELNADLDADGGSGIADLVERITKVLPDWLEAVMAEKTVEVQAQATLNHGLAQIDKLRRAGAPAFLDFGCTNALGQGDASHCGTRTKRCQGVSGTDTELDPLVSGLARLVREHPEAFQLALPIREGIDEAMTEIRAGKRLDQVLTKNPRVKGLMQIFAEMRHLGRVFQKCHAILVDRARTATEGNEIVERWDTELRLPTT